MRTRTGFTYIEILVALTLLALLFVPTMQLFSHAMEGTRTSRDLITAVSLARWEMERSKNLGTPKRRLQEIGNITWPPLSDPPFQLNGRNWRIDRILKPESDPLEVAVEVHYDQETKVLVRLVTLLEDNTWSSGPQVAQ